VSRGKTNTKDLVEKIEKLTRERMAADPVVSMDDLRRLKQRTTPRTI
jgi:hypothetical protein